MAKYLSGLLAFYLAYKAVWQKLGLNDVFYVSDEACSRAANDGVFV